MNLQELIDFHAVGAEACEAYAVTPGAAEDKNKDIGKHYNKRAKWHRDAIALVQGLSAGQGEPVAWVTQCYLSGLIEQAEPNEKATNLQCWSDAFPVYREQPIPIVTPANLMQAIHGIAGFPGVTGEQLQELAASFTAVKP